MTKSYDAATPEGAADESLGSDGPLEARESCVSRSLAAKATAEKRAALWVEENQSAFECYNTYVAKHGLPLGKYRTF